MRRIAPLLAPALLTVATTALAQDDAVAYRPASPPTTADELLTAIETADADMRSFSAKIEYTRTTTAIEGASKHVRRGQLWFSADEADANAPDDDPGRRFAVTFTELIVDEQRREETQAFIFDGQWLVEKLPDEKFMIKRRVVAPGERADPLRIGEGPFPIPIGQEKQAILERFDAKLRDPLEGVDIEGKNEASIERWKAMRHIRLVPKPGTEEARNFESVRLWYDLIDPDADGPIEARWLPRVARTTSPDGSTAQVILIGHRMNATIESATFDTTTPRGWHVEINEFRSSTDTPRATVPSDRPDAANP